LTLADSVLANADGFLIDREFAHIHNPPIGSMHATLPETVPEPRDQETVGAASSLGGAWDRSQRRGVCLRAP
jgi:hypothetical protein